MAATPSAPGPQRPERYPVNVGPKYQYYGEQPGWVYDPYNDQYHPDPDTANEYYVNAGLKEKEKKQGLGDVLIPTAAAATTVAIAKEGGEWVINEIKNVLTEEAVKQGVDQTLTNVATETAAQTGTQVGTQVTADAASQIGAQTASEVGSSTAVNEGFQLSTAEQSANVAAGVPENAIGYAQASDGSYVYQMADGTQQAVPSSMMDQVGAVMPYLGLAASAYSFYNMWADQRYSGNYGKNAAVGAAAGATATASAFAAAGSSAGPVGTAVGAIVGALVGLARSFSGSSKSMGQVMRDKYRDNLEEVGFLEYRENDEGHMSHHLRLPDGSYFDVGKEGGREGVTISAQDVIKATANLDQIHPEEQRFMENVFKEYDGKTATEDQLTADEIVRFSQMGILGPLDALNTFMSGGNEHLQGFTARMARAAAESSDPMATIQSFMDQAGLPPEQARVMLNDAIAKTEGVSEWEKKAKQNAVNAFFGDDGSGDYDPSKNQPGQVHESHQQFYDEYINNLRQENENYDVQAQMRQQGRPGSDRAPAPAPQAEITPEQIEAEEPEAAPQVQQRPGLMQPGPTEMPQPGDPGMGAGPDKPTGEGPPQAKSAAGLMQPATDTSAGLPPGTMEQIQQPMGQQQIEGWATPQEMIGRLPEDMASQLPNYVQNSPLQNGVQAQGINSPSPASGSAVTIAGQAAGQQQSPYGIIGQYMDDQKRKGLM